MLRFATFLLFALACACAQARPAFFTPTSGTQVLERLPRGYAHLEPGAAPLPPAAQARNLLAAAAATGDARLAARAERILSPLASQPEVLRLRAFAAQHRHDFAGAEALLDRLLRATPRDADALLSRAQVRIVRGRLAEARTDCAALALGVDGGDAMLCAAALASRQGRAQPAAMLADRWLAAARADDPRRGYALLLRADSASRANAPEADVFYRSALATNRDDVRAIAAYARHLRSHGHPAQALQLLSRAPRTDGLQLQRALAADALGAASAAMLASAQGKRYALSRQLGAVPELRDQAEFELSLRKDPAAALALAERNFASQRDYEDADILRRAARAAGRPEVLAHLEAWSRSQGIAEGASQ